ncbi:MAG: hypothetical protein IPM56_19300 [Ignavibacteriales bacterium]|nr:MAG: hypothetical protein IPM56_19300 [Ignavibacteriales bacterium]
MQYSIYDASLIQIELLDSIQGSTFNNAAYPAQYPESSSLNFLNDSSYG